MLKGKPRGHLLEGKLHIRINVIRILKVRGKAPCSRVHMLEGKLHTRIKLSENRLEGKLHVQELICWTVIFFLSPEFSKASCNVLKVYKVYAGGKRQRV